MNKLHELLLGYKGKDVYVLYSGGADCTMVALHLAEIGAHVTCVHNSANNVDKLGDMVSRAYAKPYLVKAGIKFLGICVARADDVNILQSVCGNPYLSLLTGVGLKAREGNADAVVFSGLLPTDRVWQSDRHIFEHANIKSPLTDLCWETLRTIYRSTMAEYTWVKNLSQCDYGLGFNDMCLPDSLTTPFEERCFKCRSSLTLPNYEFMGITFDQLEKIYGFGKYTMGKLFGHMVVHNESSYKFSFATPIAHDDISTPVYLGDGALHFSIETCEGGRMVFPVIVSALREILDDVYRCTLERLTLSERTRLLEECIERGFLLPADNYVLKSLKIEWG